MTAPEIDFEGPATLVVAWRSGRNAHGRALKAGGRVMQDLQRYADRALEKINSNSGRAYDPNDEQDEEIAYLNAEREELLDTELLTTVLKGASLPQATENDLRKRSLALYALIVGDDPERVTAFIRKKNPVKSAEKGMFAIFDETLTRVETPLMSFDEWYDVIVQPEQVRILNQKNFEGLFKESEAVLAKTAEWAENLGDVLPMPEESVTWLSKRLRETSVMRRRVQSILKSEYLPSLTADVLRDKMIERNLDPSLLISDEGLILTRDTERDILLLLNEDLWTGDFSGEQYAATRKARR